jgi:hypothetical protein
MGFSKVIFGTFSLTCGTKSVEADIIIGLRRQQSCPFKTILLAPLFVH